MSKSCTCILQLWGLYETVICVQEYPPEENKKRIRELEKTTAFSMHRNNTDLNSPTVLVSQREDKCIS